MAISRLFMFNGAEKNHEAALSEGGVVVVMGSQE